MGTIPVYNVTDYGAIGDGNTSHAAVNTAAFNSAISACSSAPGIVYVPAAVGFVVNNGSINIPYSNVVLQGAGGMGSSGGGSSTSNIIALGSGNTINITGMGCVVRDLAFQPSGAQNASYLNISQNGSSTQGQIRVDNVHMYSPYIGISLSQPSATPGEYWIERLLIEGQTVVGGISANVGSAAVNLRHVVMAQAPGATQPQYGIQVVNAGELIIDGGCDIISMGNCLAIQPGTGQAVLAVFVSDSLFDSGNGAGCVVIAPTGNGYVLTVRFSNVWASTGSNTTSTNGFSFFGSGSMSPYPSIQDVSLVNCVGKGFTNHDGLYASNVVGLSVTSSTFGGNYVGINIAGGMSNFNLIGNKCGNYTPQGGNAYYGIIINPGASDYYTVIGNVSQGNGTGSIFNGGTGSHQAVVYNVP
ncbi:MAG TPA: hypothetical protein VHC22_29370 [Pirellulales bacterium]|nr:hypothetical protein [Pirellulales bacterium]